MSTLDNLNALRLARSLPELTSWKKGQAKLLEAIALLTAGEIETETCEEFPADPLMLVKDSEVLEEITAVTPGETAEVVVEATETPAIDAVTVAVEKAPRGAIGLLVMDLLQTEMPYADIVIQVRTTYPSALTTARSIASVAMDLRADGVPVPSRRKVAKEKPIKVGKTTATPVVPAAV